MNTRDSDKLPIPLRYIFLAAMLLSIIFVLQSLFPYLYADLMEFFSWYFDVLQPFITYLLWAGLCPFIYRRLSWFSLDSALPFYRKALHVFNVVIFAAVHRALSNVLFFSILLTFSDTVMDDSFISHGVQGYGTGWVESFITLWAIVGIFVAMDYYHMYREKQLELVKTERELSNAQLNALRMQLHPHFLFNTLHTISSLMEENVKGAQNMVSQLADLLRRILEQNQSHEIPLEDELHYIRSYLDIEQVRFQDRLRITYEIDDETLDALVPNLILQPLVENAIKHGFSRQIESGTIKIQSQRQNGRLTLHVEDDGRGVREPSAILEKPGVGLKNVKDRLDQLYKHEATLELVSPEHRGFIARITMPYQAAIETTDGVKS